MAPERIRLFCVDRLMVANEVVSTLKAPPTELLVPVVINPVWVKPLPTVKVTIPAPGWVIPPMIRLFLSVMEIGPLPLPARVTAPTKSLLELVRVIAPAVAVTLVDPGTEKAPV